MIGTIIMSALELLLRVDGRLREREEQREADRRRKLADARRQLELEFSAAEAARNKAGK